MPSSSIADQVLRRAFGFSVNAVGFSSRRTGGKQHASERSALGAPNAKVFCVEESDNEMEPSATLVAIEAHMREYRVGSRQHFLFARAAYIQSLRDQGESLETIGEFARADVEGVKKILRDNEAIRDGETLCVRMIGRKDS